MQWVHDHMQRKPTEHKSIGGKPEGKEKQPFQCFPELTEQVRMSVTRMLSLVES